MDKVLCFDIGGSFVKSGLVDTTGRVSHEKKTSTPKSYEALINLITTEASESTSEIAGISLAIPGGYDFINNKIFAPNLQSLNDRNITGDIKSITKLEVKIENDANLAALGEYIFADNKAYQSLAFITLGTGVGGGLILNGRLPKSNATIFEIGHLSYEPHGRKCECGRLGCFDEYLSSGGLSKTYSEITKLGTATPNEIFELAKMNDEASLKTFEIYSEQLSCLLADIANLFCPDKIKIGGGISEMSEFFLDMAIKGFNNKVFPLYSGKVIIERARLKNKAGILGAAAYFSGM